MSDTPDSRVGSSRARWTNFFGLKPAVIAPAPQARMILGGTQAPQANAASVAARQARQAARPATVAAGDARLAANPANAASNATAKIDALLAGAAPSKPSVPLGGQYSNSSLSPRAKAPVTPITAPAKKAPAAKKPAAKKPAA